MREWLDTRPPRLQGVITCVLGTGVAMTGMLVARMLQDQFYPAVLPGGGLVFGVGFFQVVSGYGRTDIAKRKVPAAWTAALLVLMFVGVLAGLELNRALFGIRW